MNGLCEGRDSPVEGEYREIVCIIERRCEVNGMLLVVVLYCSYCYAFFFLHPRLSCEG